MKTNTMIVVVAIVVVFIIGAGIAGYSIQLYANHGSSSTNTTYSMVTSSLLSTSSATSTSSSSSSIGSSSFTSSQTTDSSSSSSSMSSKTTSSTTTTTSSRAKKNIPVGSFIYLWYGDSTNDQGGLGSPGWNSSSSPGGGSVVDTPVSGYYVSDSNQTFSRQVSEMQSAGLSFAIPSWWGPYVTGESGAINKATLDLFKFLKNNDSTFQAAIMVDSYPGATNMNTNSSLMQSIYNYVYDNFVGPYSQWYFDFQGKPLLLFFNPVYPPYQNSSFTVRTIGNRPNNVNWSFWDAPTSYFVSQNGPHVDASNDEGNPVLSPDGEISIVPRIDSYYLAQFGYFDSYMRFDPALSMGLYQSQWNFVLNHSASVHLVLIYSWNEYHERSEIEPHSDFTNSSLPQNYLLQLTIQE